MATLLLRFLTIITSEFLHSVSCHVDLGIYVRELSALAIQKCTREIFAFREFEKMLLVLYYIDNATELRFDAQESVQQIGGH